MLEKHRPGLCLQEPYSKGRLAFNGHTTQSNLQMQWGPFQIPHDIFHRTRTNDPNIYMEP